MAALDIFETLLVLFDDRDKFDCLTVSLDTNPRRLWLALEDVECLSALASFLPDFSSSFSPFGSSASVPRLSPGSIVLLTMLISFTAP